MSAMKSSPAGPKSLLEKCICLAAIAAAVFVVSVSVAEPWYWKDTSGPLTAAAAVLYGLFLAGIFYLLGRMTQRRRHILVCAGILAAFCVQMYIVFHMELVPKVDLSHVYDQCVKMVTMDRPRITNRKYYGFNTNNIPIAIVIYWVFRIGNLLGFSNYRLIGGVFNVLIILAVYCFAYGILRMITGQFAASAVMVLLLTNPALYAYAPYYYTDTVSLGIVMAGAWCMVRGSKKDRLPVCCAYFAAGGILIGFAAQIRVTSVFLLLAVTVSLILARKWKLILRYLAPTAAGFLLFTLIWSGIYNRYVPFDTYESAITVEHFLMMGSTGRGIYNIDDMRYTRSLPTHEEKVKNNLRIYRQRLAQNGIAGNLRLAIVKEAVVWGMGAHGYKQYVENVVEKNACYQWIVGKKAGAFQAYMQAYNIDLFVVILLGLLASLRKLSPYTRILMIYWGGALVFYLFWEAHPRQSVSFLPFLTMLVIPWLEQRNTE